MKGKIKFDCNHDTICHGICPETDCREKCIRETARTILERVKDHTRKDVHLHLFKHTGESKHEVLDISNYGIIGKWDRNNTRKDKIAETLLIKETKPTLKRYISSIKTFQLIVVKYLLFVICFADLKYVNKVVFFVL